MTPVKAPVHSKTLQTLPVIFLTPEGSWGRSPGPCEARIWLVDARGPWLLRVISGSLSLTHFTGLLQPVLTGD